MIRVMAPSPTVLGGYLDFTYAMQRTTLPASLRNQLALIVAEATGSRYFLALAEALGRRDGLGAQEIAAARRAELRDPGARAALRFAATMVQERGHLPLTRRPHSVRPGSATSSWWRSSRSSG